MSGILFFIFPSCEPLKNEKGLSTSLSTKYSFFTLNPCVPKEWGGGVVATSFRFFSSNFFCETKTRKWLYVIISTLFAPLESKFGGSLQSSEVVGGFVKSHKI